MQNTTALTRENLSYVRKIGCPEGLAEPIQENIEKNDIISTSSIQEKFTFSHSSLFHRDGATRASLKQDQERPHGAL